MPPLANLLTVVESHVARVLSNEQPDAELVRSIVHYLISYLERCPDYRDLGRARALAERLCEAVERKAVDREALELMVHLRRYFATVNAEDVPEMDAARLRGRFAELAHEAGCDCEYE